MRPQLLELEQRVMPDAALAGVFASSVAPALVSVHEQFAELFLSFAQANLAVADYSQAAFGNAATLASLQALQTATMQVYPAIAQSLATYPQMMAVTEELLLAIPLSDNTVGLIDTLMSSVHDAQQHLADVELQWQQVTLP